MSVTATIRTVVVTLAGEFLQAYAFYTPPTGTMTLPHTRAVARLLAMLLPVAILTCDSTSGDRDSAPGHDGVVQEATAAFPAPVVEERYRMPVVRGAVKSGSLVETPRDSVLAVIEEFFRTMTEKDSAGAARIMDSDGQYYVLQAQADSFVERRRSHASYLATVRSIARRIRWAHADSTAAQLVNEARQEPGRVKDGSVR